MAWHGLSGLNWTCCGIGDMLLLWFFSWACSLFLTDLTLGIFFRDKPSLFYFPSGTSIMIRSPFPLLKKAHVLKTWRPVSHGVMKHEGSDLTNGSPHHCWQVEPGWWKQVPGKVCLIPGLLLHGVLRIYLQWGDPLGSLHALTSNPKSTELSDHRLEPLKFWAQISLLLCCSLRYLLQQCKLDEHISIQLLLNLDNHGFLAYKFYSDHSIQFFVWQMTTTSC